MFLAYMITSFQANITPKRLLFSLRFISMQRSIQHNSHVLGNLSSFTHLLHHSFQTKSLRATKSLHAHLLRTGLIFSSLNLHIELILNYATCLGNTTFQTITNLIGFMDPTNLIPFTALISGFSRRGVPNFALQTCSFMHVRGIPLDGYVLCSSLAASSSIKMLRFGKQIHAHVSKSGWSSSVYVGTALVDLYVKSSMINDAWNVFVEIPLKNTVCVNALLSGYAEAELWIEGLELVQRMQMYGLDYDHITLSALLRICTGLAAIELGRQVHANMIRRTSYLERDVFLQSSLVEMYGRSGLVEKARHVFDLSGIRQEGNEGGKRDVVLWTSMLCSYGKNGRFDEVIRLFDNMVMKGIKPDEVAFVVVISACGHNGQVSLGIEYFKSMARDFKLEPGPEHYSCVVDLLCRAGELEMAWSLASENASNSISMWVALLSACNNFGNIELGKLAAQKALELDPQNSGIYVLLSNLYARFGMWDELEKLRELMKEKGLKKDVGCSRIEVKS
ncbi:PREDICTED: putative pentatricopeptide repeat-containing protein At1g68930 [Nelumbo nucifera]|uniref:Pentatricopeptide repeat-containing protein At1g68930 n=2 Tax=Nelumbo nucifera TaxID=4432 RepID=A0A1U8AZR0_NELNU|nr:PREDICTED: putative pentatricopeptide repeat-containing protein At1g68930 [Nelumbo nucifera]XP_019054677.1 PREDICTED: putative pentatricopeptide repeat-containing protein At1g68930 [Nelumbo nucifera]XP_019054678.1 PREDICTED: putative pentatricopeptide repeat-containing protein At1g68930 [Nelumbo nucifera]XP_019054679.1 PREDICTED: putative pentatricopeptide repeat-containing protein At1g68930 [Nelumbo nucifera]DAD22399.1 TPA_asm: hypothetical protein HUJ06_023862 [Nelumbo nucifera]